ncbi:MAG: FadR family transcriptional regulator [Chloroflexi bacterium]|nr:FadR family transcriptional regulator [Chloroflexota bacterium]
MKLSELDSDFLRHIVSSGYQPGNQLPTLGDLSDKLNISVGKLREQMEVARSLGIVDVRPRTGMRLEVYDFLPAVRYSLLFALATDPDYFQHFSALRNHIESSFWHEAVALLTDDDKQELKTLMQSAWAKLNGATIQIPHAEHKNLHLLIFSRLNNPFVKGLLEAYWEAYEAVELNLFSDYQYLREVWDYHQRIVDSILEGDADSGRALLNEHTNLLRHRVMPEERNGMAAA